MANCLQTGFGTYASDGGLDRWGACGEDDARLLVGKSIRGDQHGLARRIGRDPGLPQLNQGGRRANTNAGMRDRNRFECGREMVMSVAYDSARAKCLAM